MCLAGSEASCLGGESRCTGADGGKWRVGRRPRLKMSPVQSSPVQSRGFHLILRCPPLEGKPFPGICVPCFAIHSPAGLILCSLVSSMSLCVQLCCFLNCKLPVGEIFPSFRAFFLWSEPRYGVDHNQVPWCCWGPGVSQGEAGHKLCSGTGEQIQDTQSC